MNLSDLKDLNSEDEYAAWRGVSTRTVQRERAMRAGPPFVKVGRAVLYRREAIEQWLLAQEQAQPRAKQSA
jgi:predicted DNA-binding transcriptional regulator AlpA